MNQLSKITVLVFIVLTGCATSRSGIETADPQEKKVSIILYNPQEKNWIEHTSSLIMITKEQSVFVVDFGESIRLVFSSQFHEIMATNPEQENKHLTVFIEKTDKKDIVPVLAMMIVDHQLLETLKNGFTIKKINGIVQQPPADSQDSITTARSSCSFLFDNSLLYF